MPTSDSVPAEAGTREVVREGEVFTYREMGQGPPLVLLHGIGSGARSWSNQFAGLSARMRVVAWDAPGYGGSSALPVERPDASAYAASLARLLDALGVNRAHVVGHSLGTVVALRFAAAYPARVLSLTLASLSSGHARLGADEQTRLRNARFADLDALGPAGMAQKRAPRLLSDGATEEQKQSVIHTMSLIRPDGYRQAVWMLSGADTGADLARLPDEMPVQIIYGDADVVTTPHSIGKVAAQRPQSDVHVIAAAGHAVYVERPDEFNELLAKFALGT